MNQNISPQPTFSTRQAHAVAFLEQLTIIDQAQDIREMEEAVTATLQLIGYYTQSERVFLFDRSKTDDRFYHNTEEWRLDGLHSPSDYFRTLSIADMPYWAAAFEKGESIIIRNLEDIREKMPEEYAALKSVGVRTEIAAPIFYRNHLTGFIGLDNPPDNISDLFVKQLAFIGSHLTTARENLRMLAQQEHSLRAMEEEQQMLMVLCADSASVFRVNLQHDTAEIVKMNARTNISALLPYDHRKNICYTKELRSFYNRFIVQESAPDFLEEFSPAHLMQVLSQQSQFSRRFQMLPNPRGQQYFEARASKLSYGDNTRILVDFRYIDDIVLEERKHQQALESALADARLNNEITSAITKIYCSIYRINLTTSYFEEISAGTSEHRLTGRTGTVSPQMSLDSKLQVDPAHLGHVEPFFDLSTLGERLKNEDSIAAEYQIPDGNWHLARFIVQTRNKKGNAEQVLCVIRQISEQKHREEHWAAAAIKANEANQAKSEFLSRMSHDIRTPMNVIMGFADIAQRHPNDPKKLLECLDKIQASGKNLQQLIDDVLDISRIESGEFHIASQPMNLTEVVAFYQLAIAGMASEKHLTFSCQTHDILHNILLSDQLRLGQIYMNLLSNAVKYTPDGGAVLFEVYEEALPQKPNCVRLVSVIQDTGIGMEQEFMKRMYSEFSRAIDTRVNTVRGSGLGLAIVKKIVDLMGGKIEADSHPGRGTTFRVLLDFPFVDTAQLPTTREDVPVCASPTRPLTLLVAEDNDLNYEILAEQLEQYQVQCVRAVDGQDCIHQFSAVPPGTFDAILMDMQMPIMNGPEASAKIRTLDRPDAGRIPIIAVTANAYQEDVQTCLNAGMNAHLSKPIKVQTVLQTVLRYLPDGEHTA